MKKKNIFFIIAFLIVACAMLVFVSFAWFVDVEKTAPIYFKVGEISYNVEGFNNAFIENNKLIKPGDNLIKEDTWLYITNKSSISSELRIKIIVTINDGELIIGKSQMINVQLDEKWVQLDDYFYYFPTTDSTIIDIVDSGEENYNITNSIILDGNAFGKEIESKDVTIKLLIQAKQSNYVQWENVGTATKNL